MRIATGHHIGNNIAGRQIDVGFQPEFVLIAGRYRYSSVWKNANMPTDQILRFVDTAGLYGSCITLNANGFELGLSSYVSRNGEWFNWMAIADVGDGDFAVGTYTGNGVDNRAISGLGFQPALVLIQDSAYYRAVWKTADNVGEDTMYFHGSGDAATNYIQQMLADGFELGNNIYVNGNTRTYYYMAIKAVPGKFETGTYTGNGVDNRDLPVNHRPGCLWIKNESTWYAVSQFDANRDYDSTPYFTATYAGSDVVQKLEDSSFQVGTAGSSNANTIVHRYANFYTEVTHDWGYFVRDAGGNLFAMCQHMEIDKEIPGTFNTYGMCVDVENERFYIYESQTLKGYDLNFPYSLLYTDPAGAMARSWYVFAIDCDGNIWTLESDVGGTHVRRYSSDLSSFDDRGISCLNVLHAIMSLDSQYIYISHRTGAGAYRYLEKWDVNKIFSGGAYEYRVDLTSINFMLPNEDGDILYMGGANVLACRNGGDGSSKWSVAINASYEMGRFAYSVERRKIYHGWDQAGLGNAYFRQRSGDDGSHEADTDATLISVVYQLYHIFNFNRNKLHTSNSWRNNYRHGPYDIENDWVDGVEDLEIDFPTSYQVVAYEFLGDPTGYWYRQICPEAPPTPTPTPPTPSNPIIGGSGNKQVDVRRDNTFYFNVIGSYTQIEIEISTDPLFNNVVFNGFSTTPDIMIHPDNGDFLGVLEGKVRLDRLTWYWLRSRVYLTTGVISGWSYSIVFQTGEKGCPWYQ